MFVLNEKCIMKQNKVVEPKSVIWTNLRKKLPDNITITEKALYTADLKWWRNYQNETQNNILDDSSHSSHNFTSASSEIDLSPVVEQKGAFKFNIELSANVWDTIKPVTKIYSRKNEETQNGVRSYEVLRPGVWSNVILDHVTKKRRDIPCVWVFETNKCHREDDFFFKLKAKCKMYCSVLLGTLENEPEEREPVNITFEAISLDLSRHNNAEPKNVKIGEQYAKEVYGKNKPATVIRRSLLRKKASLFTRPYGRVSSANAIRCAKFRRRQKEKLSTCPVEAI